MKYIITPGGIQFLDDEPPEISISDAVRVLQGISLQIEALEHEPKANPDAETRVDPAARDGERAAEAA